MAEQYAPLCYTTVAVGGYTAGSNQLNVASTSTGSGIFSFPSSAEFTVSICDPTTRAPKAVLKVTGITSSTRFAVTASIQPDGQSADVNCSSGDLVIATVDGRAFKALAGVESAWTAVSFQNGWSNYGSGYQGAQYMLDRTGRVWLRGLIKHGTLTAGTVLFTLPAGFRPAAQMFFAVDDSNVQLLQVDVHTNGEVQIMSGTGSNTGTFVGLNGISFSVN